jgi:predicted NUDIX family NTP pyrophosphohydrolase
MAKQSAGILLYRRRGTMAEVFLVHPGGPFWKSKDDGAWTIPKGAVEADEDALTAALREFGEETGFELEGPFRELGTFKQPGGKLVHAWAAEGDADPAALKSNLFEMEWPPRSGRRAAFPEIDRAGWFAPETARRKILKGQKPIIEALLQRLSGAAAGQETT